MTEEFSKQELEEARKIFAGPCDFVLGVADLAQLPAASCSEVAFAGRSNVGKSSLLNALTGRKDLARTSGTPGRTQQLNFFELGGALYLVDMPGYGYAKVSKTTRREWDSLIFDYLRGRPTLRCVFVLVDARHGLKDSDETLMTMLDKAAVNYRIVLTKCDKGKNLSALEKDILETLKKHPAAYPGILQTSAAKNKGIDILRAVLIALQ
ncbi:MAG: YihA family ribosome biogenesis GTP-binding protein [Rhodospirillales bacterium]|nr:YihA family ribosome biogenesis GTP-binding protein [Alphaproteobacteria bacterium]USO03910.1 MAG: YihA family ribosome biogenesis GTP-binding protein [Rhodospirillales bacterium]